MSSVIFVLFGITECRLFYPVWEYTSEFCENVMLELRFIGTYIISIIPPPRQYSPS
jgi:hypothetical protein